MNQYKVLARKYRPQIFADLKGQEIMVKTLVNAIKQDKIAHAYLLTGIRGIGKTTTARILAKAFNCKTRKDFEPCGQCADCKAISEDSHPDVIEIDAASRTGVNDVREIIDNTKYVPVQSKYKIFIIDEVHMLSQSAFNALLKTLEEPPKHVIFIFATTEYDKIPLTILSRCQKFALKSFNLEDLHKHLQFVCEQENISYDEQSLLLIAKAANGSVRDALSLLDLAIISTDDNHLTYENITNILGFSNNQEIITLFDYLLKGNVSECLKIIGGLNDFSISPKTTLDKLAEYTHILSLAIIDESMLSAKILNEKELEIITSYAKILTQDVVSRLWQFLQKGILELQNISEKNIALEMIIIRICYAANLPTPGDIINNISSGNATEGNAKVSQELSKVNNNFEVKSQVKPNISKKEITNFGDLVQLFFEKGEMILYYQLIEDVKILEFRPNYVLLGIVNKLKSDFSRKIAKSLEDWLGEKWQIEMSEGEHSANKTYEEMQADEIAKRKEEISKESVPSEVLKHFPGAKINLI